MKASENNDILDSFEAAKLLKVGRAVLLRECRAGNVPASRIGAQWRFSRQALLDWIAEPGKGKQPEAAQPDPEPKAKARRKRTSPEQGELC